jgi:alpha-mannosidase
VTGQEDVLGTVCFLGHSHLDAAWLWSYDETKRVLGKGCENVLGLMARHNFTFCQSSAQYYKWLEEEHPGTFEKVRKKVQEGAWEIVGGAWVESDANLPSGEALVRQYLLGKRYFARKFGVDVKVAWYPDSFGFAWTLPQILRKAGMEFFLTQKLNWNDTIAFPHYFFKWRSPDGSMILAHEMVGAYDEKVEEGRVLDQLKRLKARHQMDDLLVLFGEGDHGGGVDEDMIGRAQRFVRGEGTVKGRFAKSEDYLRRATERVATSGLPEFNDELYFQFHRGTYTTQARTKRNNRKAECLLETAEKFATVAYLEGHPYPADELNEAWERLLLNQFHDVLPGSSVPEVYIDSQNDFDRIFEAGGRILSESLGWIAGQANTLGEGRPILVFNQLSWRRSGLVELPVDVLGDGGAVVDGQGKVVPTQRVGGGRFIFKAEDVPPVGYKEYRVAPAGDMRVGAPSLSATEGETEVRLENESLSVTIDKKTGLVKSLLDKAARKQVLKRPGGVIQIFEDSPVKGRTCVNSRTDAAIFDAWEVFIYQQGGGVKRVDLDAPAEVKLAEGGPVRASVRSVYKYHQKGREDSLFTQEVALSAGSPLVEFKLEVDWHAEHRLAKVAFPLDVHGDFTTYEAPYGHIARRNPVSPEATLEERAKYEVPGQKWIDHSSEDGTYGVSLLNDCKYGFDVANDVMRMTILRSAEYPFRLRAGFGLPVEETEDRVTDQGIHEAAYALYPHASGFGEALTARKGYEFNYPLIPLLTESHGGRLSKEAAFVSAGPDNVILTVLKKAEDSEGVVLRFYETSGMKAEGEIRFAWPIDGAESTDLLERREGEIPVDGMGFALGVSRGEIATVRVTPRAISDARPEITRSGP